MATSIEQVLVWCVWGWHIVCLSITTWMVCKFVAQRNEMHIKVRLPTLTYIYILGGVFMVLGRMFLEPWNCPFMYCKVTDNGSYTQTDIVYFLDNVAFIVRVTFLGGGFTLKLWYLYYALKLQTLLINNEWWTEINDNLNQNWWIKNANKYGTANKYTWIYLASYISFVNIFSIIVGFKVDQDIPRYIAGVIYVILAICVITFYCRIPKINDIFGIKKEIRLCTIYYTFCFVYFPAINFLSGILRTCISTYICFVL